MKLEERINLVIAICKDFNIVKKEIFTLLSNTLNLPENKVFFSWCYRNIGQSGVIENSNWKYFFHGLECDLRDTKGKSIRIEFGLTGRIDTFTPWGLHQFIYKYTKNDEAINLKKYLDHSSDNYKLLCSILNVMEKRNMIIPVLDIEYKNNTKNMGDEKFFNSIVSQRKIINPKI